jgi:DNA (cytosine-5)-methyltransferase 1
MQNEHTSINTECASRKPIRFLSLFSGIEAASVAWKPLCLECAGVAEIEPFPSALLAHHYPDVPNLGNVTGITEEQIKQLAAR